MARNDTEEMKTFLTLLMHKWIMSEPGLV